MDVDYKDRFRAEMVKRMLAPNAPSQGKLALETGVPQPTLSRWLREATTLDEVAKKKPNTHGGKRPGAGHPPGPNPKPRRRRRRGERTADEKLQIVLEAARLSDEELGAYLREKGLFEAELLEWRQQMLSGLRAEPAVRPATPAEVKRARDLERELRRKEKALAEAAALIVLKKKVQDLWGDEDDDTDSKSDK